MEGGNRIFLNSDLGSVELREYSPYKGIFFIIPWVFSVSVGLACLLPVAGSTHKGILH